jgi:hypothetical protein
MPTSILDPNSNQSAGVDAGVRSLRAVLRPVDWTSGGAFAIASATGTMAAGLAAASPIWSTRYNPTAPAGMLLLVRRIELSAATLTGFTVGLATFNLFIARSFTASDTGGAALTLTSPANKQRTTMNATQIVDFRTSSTATLTAGTRTLDGNPVGTIELSLPSTANVQMISPNTTIWDVRPGEQPIVLAANEGLVLQATVPATGTWTLGLNFKGEEILATNPSGQSNWQ